MIKLLKFGMQIKMKLLVCFIIAIKISTSFIINSKSKGSI